MCDICSRALSSLVHVVQLLVQSVKSRIEMFHCEGLFVTPRFASSVAGHHVQRTNRHEAERTGTRASRVPSLLGRTRETLMHMISEESGILECRFHSNWNVRTSSDTGRKDWRSGVGPDVGLAGTQSRPAAPRLRDVKKPLSTKVIIDGDMVDEDGEGLRADAGGLNRAQLWRWLRADGVGLRKRQGSFCYAPSHRIPGV